METEPGLFRMVAGEDYPMLASWWQGHGWQAVPQRVLPPLGIIYADTAAGWLYMDNGGTGVAMMEWLVTNPAAKPLDAARALRKVVAFLKDEAKRMEYPIILTTCRQPGLARLLGREGFSVSDTEMIHLIGVFP
jgi:hypothetical protein